MRRRGRIFIAGLAMASLGAGTAGGVVTGVLSESQAGATGCNVGISIRLSAVIHELGTGTVAPTTTVARAGDTVDYAVTVHNDASNCTFETGMVALKLPTGATVQLTTHVSLAPGASQLFAPVAYTVADANLSATTSDVVATATVSGKEPEVPGTRNPQAVSAATQYTVFVIHPETGLSVSAVPNNGVVPVTVQYTITESNTSIDPADVLPTDSISTVVVTTTPTCTLSGPVSSDGTAVLLNPGAHWTYACTVSYPTAGGPFAFDVTATGNAGDGREAGTSATDGAPADETASATVTVTKASPTVVTSPQPASGPFGTTLNDQITLSGLVNPSTTAPGTITAELFPPSEAACTGTPAFTDTLTASGNASYTTASNSTGHVANIAGIWHWTAVYSGDTNNRTATSGCAAEPVAIAPATSTIATVAHPTSGPAGSTAFTDTATVTGTALGGAPTGTVSFTVCGPSSGDELCTSTTSGHTAAGTITVPSSTTTDAATFTSNAFTPTTAGTYCFSSVFAPTTGGNYNGSSDNVTGTVESTECVTATVPNFSVHKSDLPGTGLAVTPGETIPYSVTVTNLGTGPGLATVSDPLPTNLAFSGTPSCNPVAHGDTCDAVKAGSALTITVALAAGDSATVLFDAVVSPSDTTSVVNTATITAGRCVPTAQCSSTVTNPVPVLSVVKTSSPTPGSTVGQSTTVTYSLKLTNSGSGVASNVTVTDTVPTGTSYVASSASCGGAPGCKVSESGGKVTWTGLTVGLGSANAITITFQVTVNPTDTNGEVLSNFGVFTNAGTPGCTAATCDTNTVTLIVLLRSTAASGGTATPPTTTTVTPAAPTTAAATSTAPAATVIPPRSTAAISGATTVHTGEPWAGSRWLELLVLAAGLSLAALGTVLRRRHRKLVRP